MMPGPVPGIVNTKMTETWSLSSEVQSQEKTCKTEGLVKRREVCAGGSHMEEVAWRPERERPAPQAGEGQVLEHARRVGGRLCWEVTLGSEQAPAGEP